jgi:hypothetical protein
MQDTYGVVYDPNDDSDVYFFDNVNNLKHKLAFDASTPCSNFWQSNEFLYCVQQYNELLNRVIIWDLADFGETPTPMSYIDMGSFTPQPETFQPKTIKTSSSMEAILFIADTNQVLVLDISDIRNNNTAILSKITSKAT